MTEQKIKPRITPAVKPQISDAVSTDLAAKPTRVPREASAAERAAQLRKHRVNRYGNEDEFDVSYLDGDGWTHQWHSWSLYEQRQISNMMASEERGWQTVPRSDHPELMPKDSDMDVIMRKGMILMRIPTEILEEYRAEDIKAARDQVRFKEAQLQGTPEGHFERNPGQTRIRRSYESMPVPDK